MRIDKIMKSARIRQERVRWPIGLGCFNMTVSLVSGTEIMSAKGIAGVKVFEKKPEENAVEDNLLGVLALAVIGDLRRFHPSVTGKSDSFDLD